MMRCLGKLFWKTDDEVGGKSFMIFFDLINDQIDNMMRVADLDGDGKMKFSEFSKLMEHLLPVIKEKSQREVRMVMMVTVRLALPTMAMVLGMTVTKVKVTAPVLPSPSAASGVRDLWSRVCFFIVTHHTTLAHSIWPYHFSLRKIGPQTV